MLYDITYLKDKYLSKHHVGVCRMACSLANVMGLNDMSLYVVKYASLVHDIGKISVPNEILFKKGLLTEEEFKIMKLHPITAADLLVSVKISDEARELIIKAVRHHHERWDGKGYPDGLSGDNIPLAARIIAVADTYDAITTTRPYRSASSSTEAIEEIINHTGTQFDPDVAELLKNNRWRKWYSCCKAITPRDCMELCYIPRNSFSIKTYFYGGV